MNRKIIFSILIIFIVIGLLLVIAGNQIISQQVQISLLHKSLDDKDTSSEKSTRTNKLNIETNVPSSTLAPTRKDPHTGMKEVKGMDCRPQGNLGETSCTEYDYWYSPNDKPSTGTLSPDMLQ